MSFAVGEQSLLRCAPPSPMNTAVFAPASPASMGRDPCRSEDLLLRGRKRGFESLWDAEGMNLGLVPFST